MDSRFTDSGPHRPRLRSEWLETLGATLAEPEMQTLAGFLRDEKAMGKVIYPPRSDIFNALQLTPPDAVRVVILGQDPYHGFDQANGLCFSVNKKTKLPPSLKNIFKELSEDINCKINHGDLNPWTKQGVFLLNTSLTVVQGNPGSHSKIGWEIFTDNIIKQISNKNALCVTLTTL